MATTAIATVKSVPGTGRDDCRITNPLLERSAGRFEKEFPDALPPGSDLATRFRGRGCRPGHTGPSEIATRETGDSSPSTKAASVAADRLSFSRFGERLRHKDDRANCRLVFVEALLGRELE
jgi:hypothetical protein